MTVKGPSSQQQQACAACKYQRRKCTADCPLAPYFPADQPKQFQNAHRLFGVSNILKILNKLAPGPQKDEAMRSILYESDARARYPATGCAGIIVALHFQIQQTQLELDAVNAHLTLYRQQQQISVTSSSSSSPMFNNEPALVAAPFDVAAYGSKGDGIDVNAAAPLWASAANHSYAGGCYNVNMNLNNSGAVVAAVQQGYDEISPYFDSFHDDQHDESSSDSSPKETTTTTTMERVTENELKSAAACFTLTSVVN